MVHGKIVSEWLNKCDCGYVHMIMGITDGSMVVCPMCGCVTEVTAPERPTQTIGDIIKGNEGIQQLVEVCMSYMWDRVSINEPELEYLVDMLGIDDGDIFSMFNQLGYEYENEEEEQDETLDEEE